jgi:hypothetical protein
MAAWAKTIGGDFDRIELSAHDCLGWLNIEMHVGHDADRVCMVIRSTEAVRDLHYALGRYLAEVDKAELAMLQTVKAAL